MLGAERKGTKAARRYAAGGLLAVVPRLGRLVLAGPILLAASLPCLANPTLFENLADPSSRKKIQTLAAQPQLRSKDVLALLHVVREGGDESDRLAALYQLSLLEKAKIAEPLAKILQTEESLYLRRGIARVLCARGDGRGYRFLLSELEDDYDPDTKLLFLADLLYVPPTEEVKTALARFARRKNEPERIRALASRILRQMNATGGGAGNWRYYGTAALILILVLAAALEGRRSASPAEGSAPEAAASEAGTAPAAAEGSDEGERS